MFKKSYHNFSKSSKLRTGPKVLLKNWKKFIISRPFQNQFSPKHLESEIPMQRKHQGSFCRELLDPQSKLQNKFKETSRTPVIEYLFDLSLSNHNLLWMPSLHSITLKFPYPDGTHKSRVYLKSRMLSVMQNPKFRIWLKVLSSRKLNQKDRKGFLMRLIIKDCTSHSTMQCITKRSETEQTI